MNNRRAWAAIASFPPHPENVRHARRIARTALAAWGADDLVDSAEMLVSELVTNAMRYGCGPVDLTLALTGDCLRIAVADEGPCLPVPRTACDDAQSGRGLMIVEMLADSWEVSVRLTGKTVSCTLALPAVKAVSSEEELPDFEAALAATVNSSEPRVRPSGEHGA
jgi:anti-sigma regulatory factor (Ser/Thr protein kinase)